MMNILSFLQNYIRINTAQPKPNYSKALIFLETCAHSDGFTTNLIPLASGKKVLVITLQGTNSKLQSIVLNHHMDVVPAGAGTFIHGAFDGKTSKNKIFGRGTQDMKGVAAVHYYALKKFKQLHGNPKRTIHLFAVPDEEIGGFTGTAQLVKTTFFKNLNVGFVLDEGLPSGNNNVLFIKVAERKPLQIQLTSTGHSAHGSSLKAGNALHNLVAVLNEVVNFQHSQQIKARNKEPGLLLSANITSISTDATAVNTIPSMATTTIDIRIPLSIPNAKVHQQLKQLLKKYPSISYKVIAEVTTQAAGKTNTTSKFYTRLSNVIRHHGKKAQALHFEGTTDVRFYLDQGIEGLGFTPFTCKPNLHGADESIGIQELITGEQIMLSFLINFCL